MMGYWLLILVAFPFAVSCYAGNQFLRDVDIIRDQIKRKQYSTALFRLQTLISEIREVEAKLIRGYFPSQFLEFSVRDQGYGGSEFIGSADQYGVLFSQQYYHPEGYTIDVNVVYSDPAIDEYRNIIDNPDLLDRLDENTSIVTVNATAKAIQRFSEPEHYIERNVVLNKDTLVSIIMNGIPEIETMNDYCNQVNWSKLNTYLTH